MPNIIIHGLKSTKLLTRGFGLSPVVFPDADILQIDYGRDIFNIQNGRVGLQVDMARDILDLTYGRANIQIEDNREIIQNR